MCYSVNSGYHLQIILASYTDVPACHRLKTRSTNTDVKAEMIVKGLDRLAKRNSKLQSHHTFGN